MQLPLLSMEEQLFITPEMVTLEKKGPMVLYSLEPMHISHIDYCRWVRKVLSVASERAVAWKPQYATGGRLAVYVSARRVDLNLTDTMASFFYQPSYVGLANVITGSHRLGV
jgi:hypothetical protein